jgi:uncharacterized membrane protein
LVGFRDGTARRAGGGDSCRRPAATPPRRCSPGRAAFLLVGATLATIMSANVFFVIIPGQKRMVGALQQGETPNPLDGARQAALGAQHLFHLPVVFAMLSVHYGAAFAHEWNWLCSPVSCWPVR